MKTQLIMKRIFIFLFLILASVSCKNNERHRNVKLPAYEFAYFELIRREGIKLEQYTCPAGYTTIGIGHRFEKKCPKKITLKMAKSLAKNNLQKIHDVAEKDLPNLSHNELLAVSLFIYNFGHGYFLRSDLYTAIKTGRNINKVWKKYVYYKDPESNKMILSDNLMTSRKNELALFNSDEKYISKHTELMRSSTIKLYSHVN